MWTIESSSCVILLIHILTTLITARNKGIFRLSITIIFVGDFNQPYQAEYVLDKLH